MCVTCGCSDDATTTITEVNGDGGHVHRHVLADGTVIEHRHAHGHEHPHGDEGQGQGGREIVELEREILAKNASLAERNRGWFSGRGVYAVNVMSSPGAGKTTLLARTIRDITSEVPVGVIEGDQAMSFDADRIREAGAPVVQVNTGKGCHLEADMVAKGLRVLDPRAGSLVVIENVGNLVCPALFDLGEHAKVVILSVTEGDDKPLKYPHMFRAADVVLLTKVDLLPHLDFDVDRCIGDIHKLRPGIPVLQVSAKTGDGLDTWYDWLRQGRQALTDDSPNDSRPIHPPA